MTPSQDRRSSRRVLVDLEPRLLTQLLQQMLAARGVTALDLATAAGEHVDVALLGGAVPADLDAGVMVRMTEAGWDMPAVVEIRPVGAKQPRAVELANVDELVDLLTALASG